MPELVSILIPAYNAERWIGQTISSAIAQDWSNKEIIVVDDGSSDNTLNVARSFESNIVKVLATRNGGASRARNTALTHAQGTYIQFLDADDLLAVDKLSRQLRGADAGLHSRTLLTAAWGMFFRYPQRMAFRPDSLWEDLPPVEWILRKFTDGVWMNPAVWLVSRRLAELAGPWDERLSRSGDDDGEYMCRLVKASQLVHFVPEARAYYRIGNPGSLGLGSKKTGDALEAFLLATSLCIDHLISMEDSDRTRHASLQYLQILFHYFVEDTRLSSRARELARSLGGELAEPRGGLKYSLVRRVAGESRAKRLKYALASRKLKFLRVLEQLAYCCGVYDKTTAPLSTGR
jgi:glycosyltransferase involved in cell wall biosynthesis